MNWSKSKKPLGATLLGMSLLLGSACSSGPADISCAKFLERGESEQMEIVKAWREKKNLATVKDIEDLIVSQDREAMVSYCTDPEHAEDKLTQLDYSWG